MTTSNPTRLLGTPNAAHILFLLATAGLHSDNSIFIPAHIPPPIQHGGVSQGRNPLNFGFLHNIHSQSPIPRCARIEQGVKGVAKRSNE